ncbi:MAG: hypothetical protein A2068_10395 [Ignavibacteria bacterium GWB2_35_6b]|nr:MAG: hypothetical protein A2068_10395 [Ignavibacteria bacterium GWB2_35_6b]
MKKIFISQLIVFFLLAGLLVFANPVDEKNKSTNSEKEKISVIIVGHGAPAKDFPKLKEYFQLHEHGSAEAEALEEELLNWPRTAENDPYWAGFIEVVNDIKKSGKYFSVHYAFNEMCAPTVKEALKKSLEEKPDVVIVTSIMVTPGGGHSEKDIPAEIEVFREFYPGTKIIYAWPYDVSDISGLLMTQVNKFAEKNNYDVSKR